MGQGTELALDEIDAAFRAPGNQADAAAERPQVIHGICPIALVRDVIALQWRVEVSRQGGGERGPVQHPIGGPEGADEPDHLQLASQGEPLDGLAGGRIVDSQSHEAGDPVRQRGQRQPEAADDPGAANPLPPSRRGSEFLIPRTI
jgi:hypothetical protein